LNAQPAEFSAERLLQLSEDVSRIASKVAELSMSLAASPSHFEDTEQDHSAQQIEVSREMVEWLIKVRKGRRQYLPADLFADPAWDILLDLLRAELVQHRVPVSSLCIAAGVPTTTALRWITNMVNQGLLLRRPDPRDGRRIFIELSPDVSGALRRYFVDIIGSGPALLRCNEGPRSASNG
jgi:DNA-binding MarR family transcriptional regulator